MLPLGTFYIWGKLAVRWPGVAREDLGQEGGHRLGGYSVGPAVGVLAKVGVPVAVSDDDGVEPAGVVVGGNRGVLRSLFGGRR